MYFIYNAAKLNYKKNGVMLPLIMMDTDRRSLMMQRIVR